MHAKSGLRVVLNWKICRPDCPDSVIAAVIRLNSNSFRLTDAKPIDADRPLHYMVAHDHTQANIRR